MGNWISAGLFDGPGELIIDFPHAKGNTKISGADQIVYMKIAWKTK